MICEKCRHNNVPCEECGSPARRSFISRHKGMVIASVLIFIFIIFPVILIVGLIIAASSGVGDGTLHQTEISGSGPDKIALINVDGVIMESSPHGGLGISEDVTTERKIKKILNAISKESDVQGLIVRVNSPGGSAVASEEIYRDFQDYKRTTGKKVTFYFSDIAASGGYYVAQAGDRIIANPSNITGSIGVIISYLTFGDLAAKYGVQDVIYKSGPHKDIVSEFRQPTTEEKQIMQSIVDDSYANFVKAVAKGRNLPEDNVRTLADGRVYSARQAVEAKLVDSLGTFSDAVDTAKKLANLKEATVVEYGREGFLDTFLGGVAGKINVSLLPLPQRFFSSQSPKVLYLYQP